jgi:hypothetical protein
MSQRRVDERVLYNLPKYTPHPTRDRPSSTRLDAFWTPHSTPRATSHTPCTVLVNVDILLIREIFPSFFSERRDGNVAPAVARLRGLVYTLCLSLTMSIQSQGARNTVQFQTVYLSPIPHVYLPHKNPCLPQDPTCTGHILSDSKRTYFILYYKRCSFHSDRSTDLYQYPRSAH